MHCLFINRKYQSADDSSVFPDSVSNSLINAGFNYGAGNDFSVFFKMTVSFSEFFHRSVFKSTLVIQNKRFAVRFCKRGECNN